MATALAELRRRVRKEADPKKAPFLRKYFKTGKGEYGEGDRFVGLMVPQSQKIARDYGQLSLADIKTLLMSSVHEERLIALLIAVNRFKKAAPIERKKIFGMYLKHTRFINNWDLVDSSAEYIVGAYIEQNGGAMLLEKLARSKSLWERRISMLATFHFIKRGRYQPALKIARLLLSDSHDLIHKAVGWMLREVGNRDLEAEEEFLKQYHQKMPRTALRYAIEKFPQTKRMSYVRPSKK